MCFDVFFTAGTVAISEILPLTPFIISRLVTNGRYKTTEPNVPVLPKKRMATLVFLVLKSFSLTFTNY